MARYVIETWREEGFVRTRVLDPNGTVVPLPWIIDCLTHCGAQRKARRHVARQAAVRRVYVPDDGGTGDTGTAQ